MQPITAIKFQQITETTTIIHDNTQYKELQGESKQHIECLNLNSAVQKAYAIGIAPVTLGAMTQMRSEIEIKESAALDFSSVIEPAFLDKVLAIKPHITRLNANVPQDELFVHKRWHVDYYGRENYPVVLGELENKSLFSAKRNGTGMRFLDMPIYMPGQGWKIPSFLEQFTEVLQQAIAFERQVNPEFEKECYVYITVDQGEVAPGKAQRRTGWHGDSYVKKKAADIACDHVYVVADNCPTPFMPGPFLMDEVDPENIDEVLAHFAKVAEAKVPVYYPEYTLLKLNPYCVHNVGFNHTAQTLFRTFVKVSVSRNRYCKLGNAKNVLFIYDWPMIPRHNVPYTKAALQQSAHRKDRDCFIEITPKKSIDFSQDSCKVSWAKPTIRTAIRTGEIFAKPAQIGEMLTTVNDGFLVTILSADKGDWKVIASHGNQYFLSQEKINRFYDQDPMRPDVFVPKPITRRVVELTADVRFFAPWGTLQYAQKGDMLMSVDESDIYAVPKVFFDNEYRV